MTWYLNLENDQQSTLPTSIAAHYTYREDRDWLLTTEIRAESELVDSFAAIQKTFSSGDSLHFNDICRWLSIFLVGHKLCLYLQGRSSLMTG